MEKQKLYANLTGSDKEYKYLHYPAVKHNASLPPYTNLVGCPR